MPNTMRINMASSNPTTELIDDVINSQQTSWHESGRLEANVSRSWAWPSTDPFPSAYMRFRQDGSPHIISVKGSASEAGYQFVIGAGVAFRPIILSRPNSGLLILVSDTAVPWFDIFWF
jgi:hypothetical protein